MSSLFLSPVTDPAGPSIAMSMRFLFALYIVVADGTTTPAALTVADRLRMTPSAVTVLAVTLLKPGVKDPSPGHTGKATRSPLVLPTASGEAVVSVRYSGLKASRTYCYQTSNCTAAAAGQVPAVFFIVL